MDKNEQYAFEAAARKGLDIFITRFDFQLTDDDEYKWAFTRRLFEFWQLARASQAPAPSPAASIGEDKEFRRLLDRCEHADAGQGYANAWYALIAHIDAHCARLASQSASAKDAAYNADQNLSLVVARLEQIVATEGEYADNLVDLAKDALPCAVAARAAMTKEAT